MRSLRTGVALVMGLALSACALLTDFGSLSSGDESPNGDAGTGAVNEDTGVGTGDGGALPNDGAATSCGHLLCEDFDDDAGFARWQSRVNDPAAPALTIGIDSVAATTAPSAFVVDGQPLRWTSAAYLQKVFELGQTAALQCSFDVRLGAVPPDGQYVVFEIIAPEAVPAHGAALNIRGGGTRVHLVEDFVTDAGPTGLVDGPTLATNQWSNLVVTLERTPSPVFRLSDGVQVWTMPLSSWPSTTKLALQIGLVLANPYQLDDAHIQIRYDSVRCDAL